MLCSALASRSAVLIMHAMFLVPSLVAIPCLRPVIASERAGQCIPGLQSKRNNTRIEAGVQSSTDVASDRVAVGYELIATSCSLAMPTIVKAAALTCVAPFNRNGEQVTAERAWERRPHRLPVPLGRVMRPAAAAFAAWP